MTITGYVQAQNLLRGVISAALSKRFVEGEDSTGLLKVARQRMLRTQIAVRPLIREDEYERFLTWQSTQITRQIPALWKEPLLFNELGLFVSEPPLSLSHELHWARLRLNQEVSSICEFRRLVKMYERALWLADYQVAQNVIDELEEKFGASIWLVDARISLAQLAGGLEAQKKVADEIKNKSATRLPGYLAFWTSVRNEPATTVQGFSERINSNVLRPGFTPALRIYSKYKLYGLKPTTESGWASILQIEESNSIFDLYETFISVVQHFAAFDREENRDKLQKLVTPLLGIEDSRLAKINAELSGQRTQLKVLSLSGSTVLSAGRTRDALKISLRAFKDDPLRINDLNAAAIALAFGKLPNLKKTEPIPYVLARLARLHLKGQEFEQAFNELQKFSLNYGLTLSGKQLASVVEIEGHAPSSDRRYYKKNKELNTPHIDERDRIGLFGTVTVEQFAQESALKKLTEKYQKNLTRKSLYELVGDLNIPRPLRISISMAVLNLALEEENISRAASIAASEYVRESEVRRVIPVDRIMGVDGWKSLKQYSGDISVPILFDMAWRIGSDSKTATYRRYATQQFLTKNGCEKPSELSSKTGNFELEHLIYFLRYICVPTVLDMLPTLSSSQEIDDERSQICSILSQIDPANSDIYHDEILQNANKKIMQAGLKALDGSRIYVDQDSISRVVENELAEDFLRYQTLVKAGIGQSDKFDSVLKMILRSSASAVFELPDSEADALLLQMVASLQQKFLFDAKYGLDSFLSQRIRHGTLQIYLRSPLEAAHLVTQRGSESSAYLKNSYWLSKLRTLTPQQAEKVNRVFERFSDGFDRMLLRLKDQLFQIKSLEHTEGIFSLELNAGVFLVLRSVVQQDLTLKDFISSCFIYFWAILDPSLRAARETLQDDFMTGVVKEFEILRAGLYREAASDPGFADLSTAIGDASSKVQNEIGLIASWLNRTETGQGSHRYTMKQAIEVAMHSALSTHRSFEPNVTLNVCADTYVAAGELAVIADVIRVAFGNVALHSGMGNTPDVALEATLDNENETLRFTFTNQVKLDSRTTAIDQKLDDLRAKIKESKYGERVRKEGGSGFLKLANLVLQSKKGHIEFGFKDDTTFVLEVGVSFFAVPSFLRN